MKPISRRQLIKSTGSVIGLSVLGIPLTHLGPDVKKLKVVVTGGHPDDPETGCGGLIALLTQMGHDVTIGYLTRGEAGIVGTSNSDAASIRTKEAEKACEILNCKHFFMGQVDGDTFINLDEYNKVHEFLKLEAPDLLITQWPLDSHRDHRICSALTFDAWRQLQNKPDLYFYEVMSGIQTQNFSPTDFVDITSVKSKKREACYAHKSQNLEKYYDEFHIPMEEFRGWESGHAYAEAYVRHSHNPQRITSS